MSSAFCYVNTSFKYPTYLSNVWYYFLKSWFVSWSSYKYSFICLFSCSLSSYFLDNYSHLIAISFNWAWTVCYLSSHYALRILLVLISFDIYFKAFWYLTYELGILLDTMELPPCWLIFSLTYFLSITNQNTNWFSSIHLIT